MLYYISNIWLNIVVTFIPCISFSQLRRLLSPEHTLTDHDRQEVIRIIDSGADVNTPEADGEDVSA